MFLLPLPLGPEQYQVIHNNVLTEFGTPVFPYFLTFVPVQKALFLVKSRVQGLQ